jgi:hypothetical protein
MVVVPPRAAVEAALDNPLLIHQYAWLERKGKKPMSMECVGD